MKNIVTIQHTQAVHHTNGMMGSWTDWELTDLGKKHAENIGRKLSFELKRKAYKIYSSDLIRARQTAEPLAGYMGVEIEYRVKLREHNIGEAVGKTRKWAKENALPVLDPLNDPQFRGAETWRELWHRVAEFCDEIVADETENVILVSHGGTLSVLQAVWLGLEIKEFNRFGSPGGVSFLNINDKGEREIHRVNDLSFIED